MKPATTIAAILLALLSLAHLVRLILGVEFIAAGHAIPQWASVLGFLVPGALAVWVWREHR